MTQLEKLIRRLTARPPDARFEDVRRVLEAHGWSLARQSGSHCTFSKPGEPPVVIPLVAGRSVKRPYLDRICDLLGLDDPEA